jgi:glucose/arabinose dehydrogenase
MTRKRIALIVATPVLLVACVAIYRVAARILRDPIAPVYAENCAVCHGESLEGTPLGTPLVGRELSHGDSADAIAKSISEGFALAGMPAWSATLDEAQIRGLAILISEKRAALGRTDFKTDMPLVIPEGVIESEQQAFRIESVASGLDPLPFSIAPLPDGRFLLTEKMRGLSIVSPDGKRSALIEGTPPAHADGFELADLVYGRGWLLDVALHPDYAKNGWVYLHFGDRCRDCDTSMNKLIRGHIADGRWTDEETIWSAAPETYNKTPDMGAGGRIAFDGNGHVFLSVGIKGPSDHDGIQDLGLPYGKIHRVHDDGRIPADNPFVNDPGALKTTWTYGHRSPQGLEFDPVTGRLWSTEMGPRGGDEFNLLRPGRNYGWPLTSKGVNYDGTPVAWGEELGITLDLATIEQPVVDLTPSPAVSSFVLYRGSAFPGWQDDAIVGTLKATELYRFVIEGERVVHRETLLKGLARIRDVEVGPDGLIYLLLEHASGGRIVRLVPAGGG